MNYQESLDWLNQLASERQFFKNAQPPSLVAVNQALDALGRPDASFKYRVIVGGTAGKGSVCRLVEHSLLASGRRVALISSPHLQVVNERIRINGKLIGQAEFAAVITKVKTLMEQQDISLTFYEVIVVVGILAAAENSVEILIAEVGLGGAFDAVNAVKGKRIAAVTFIGDDHREILGPTLADIAKTKAGIFTNDSISNITFEQKFCSIFNKTSNNNIVYIKGIKQKLNKKLARKILDQLNCSYSSNTHKNQPPCRWEAVDQEIILDGAHSTPRFEYLKQTKLAKFPGPYTLVLGMQKNHDPEGFKLLFPYATNIIWTQINKIDAHSATDLKLMHEVGIATENPSEALKLAQEFSLPILVTGSLYLCGVIRESFYPSWAILEQQTEWPVLEK